MSEALKLAYLDASNKLFTIITVIVVVLLILNRVGTWFVLPRKSVEEVRSFLSDDRNFIRSDFDKSGTFFYAVYKLFTNPLAWVTVGALERRLENGK